MGTFIYRLAYLDTGGGLLISTAIALISWTDANYDTIFLWSCAGDAKIDMISWIGLFSFTLMGYAKLLISGSFIRSSPLNLRLYTYFLELVGVFTLGNALFFGVA